MLSILVLISPVLAGCGGVTEPPDTEEVRIHGLSPATYGTIGARISQQPDRSDEILKSHDLTRAQFKEAIQRITSDTRLAKQYRRSFERTLIESHDP